MGELRFSPQTNVGRRLSGVKYFSHQLIYDEITREYLLYVKEKLERRFLMVQEELVGCERYERSEGRQGYRHGFHTRSWTTRLGEIKGLRVPRIQGRRSVVTALIGRYQRREGCVDEVMLDSFLHGLATRQACQVLEKLNGVRVSATTVSRIFAGLDCEVRAFHRRALSDRYRFLVLDGVQMKVFLGPVVKRQVLCALGITHSGKPELLGFVLASSESEANWLALLNDLQRRGLKGESLELITADGAGGIWAAVAQLYPGVDTQLCTFHKIHNATEKLKHRAHRKRFSTEASAVYNAPTIEGAYRRLRRLSQRWRKSEPAAVSNFSHDFERTLAYYKLPRKDWKTARTTSLVERFFEEVRRRLRPMRVLPNIPSLERNFYARAALFNAKHEEEHTVKIIEFPQNS